MQTVKVNVRELSGAALDWCVAKCEGWEGVICKNPSWAVPNYIATNSTGLYTYAPSASWTQGGFIIERELICVWWDGEWHAKYDGYPQVQDAHTALIAAMRCYVASKLGEVVEFPEELLK